MILTDPVARPVIAHRGASGAFPENTIRAFRAAVAAGADAVELDVRITADGVPVALHDPTLDRTTDGSGALNRHRAAAVAELDAGAGEVVPRLETVLEAVPGIPLIIEIKEREAVPAVVEVVRRTGAAGRVVLGSFLNSVVRQVRGLGFHTTASRIQTGMVWTAARVPGPLLRVRAAAFSVPEFSGRIRVVDGRFLRRTAAIGIPVHVWTVDDPDRAVRLWTAGVSGIITNWPDRILATRGMLEVHR